VRAGELLLAIKLAISHPLKNGAEMNFVGDYAPGIFPVEYEAEGLTLANLEGPVLSPEGRYRPAPKAGPNLSTQFLPQSVGQFAFSLANNHSMDFGSEGLASTTKILKGSCAGYAGAGENLQDARRPLMLEEHGVRFVIIACCEEQFGVAQENKAGVACFGPWMYRAIERAKQGADFVVVSVHSAVEESPWPSPGFQDSCRSWIDAGASVVHGHHAHVPQGVEQYGNGVIAYGLGNFAVDPLKWSGLANGLWSISLALKLGEDSVEPVVNTLCVTGDGRRIVVKRESGNIRKAREPYLDACSQPLRDRTLLTALWHEVALRTFKLHYSRYFGWHERTLREITADAWREMRGRRQLPHLLLHHLFVCASHREAIGVALGILGGEINDERTSESGRLADSMMPWSKDNSGVACP
jgi:hypothetical protein